MPTYNHAFDIAFAIPHSSDPTGENVTAIEIRQAIYKRLNSLSDDELLEAVGLPFHTYEELSNETSRTKSN